MVGIITPLGNLEHKKTALHMGSPRNVLKVYADNYRFGMECRRYQPVEVPEGIVFKRGGHICQY